MADIHHHHLKQKTACNTCNLAQLCLPAGLNQSEWSLLNHLIIRERALEKRAHLFEVEQPVKSLFTVRAGTLKTFCHPYEGYEQIVGFHLPGELFSFNTMNSHHYPIQTEALTDSLVCELPLEPLLELARQIPRLQMNLFTMLSCEASHRLAIPMCSRSDQRLILFLLHLSDRLQRYGFSATQFHLHMSRKDIGNYLGLTIETVSRIFSRLQQQKLLKVCHRDITLLDPDKMHYLACHAN